MQEQIREQLINLLLMVVSGGLTAISIMGAVYINKGINLVKRKAQQIDDEDAKKRVNDALDRVNNLLQTNIVNAEVTLKSEIVKGISDNVFTKEDFASLKDSVVNNVIRQLSDDSMNLLNTELGDVNSYISVKLEEILANLKEDPNSVVQHTVIEEVK